MQSFKNLRILRRFLIFGIFVLFPLFLIIAFNILFGNNSFLQDYISFLVSMPDGSTYNVKSWYNDMNEKYYAFLPSCASDDTTSILLSNNIRITIADNEVKNGMMLNQIGCGELPIILYNKNGSVLEESILEIIYTENIPSMFIDTESGNIENIHKDKSYKENAKIAVITSQKEINYMGDITIKGRGNATWGGDKKPYNIQLNDEVNLLEMRQSKEWVLLANYNDGSNIRNKIVHETALKVGLKYSSKSEFVDLYINSEYLGLYQLSEKVNVEPKNTGGITGSYSDSQSS